MANDVIFLKEEESGFSFVIFPFLEADTKAPFAIDVFLIKLFSVYYNAIV